MKNKEAGFFLIILALVATLPLYAAINIPLIETGSAVQNNSSSKAEVSFSVTERPEAPDDGGAGGGGGGGAPSEEPDGENQTSNLTVDKESFSPIIKPEETTQETLTIENIGEAGTNVIIEIENVEDFTAIEQKEFYLEAGNSVEIDVNFFAKADATPDIYTGRIKIKGANNEKTINTYIEVKPREALLDMVVEAQNESLLPEKNIYADINSTNLGDNISINSKLIYSIKDFDNNTITTNEEMVEFSESLNIRRNLDIPEGTDPGEYLFYAKIPYQDKSAVGADTFEVREKTLEEKLEDNKNTVILWLIILIILLLIIILILYMLSKREEINE